MIREKKKEELPYEYLAGVIIISVMILLCLVVSAHAQSIDEYADSIFWSEGGYETNYPYGIKSVSCDGMQECRRVCKNTIRNNIKRYADYGYKKYDDFLSFLASRYCPVKGDKTGLNKNWIGNVKWFLKNPKEVIR